MADKSLDLPTIVAKALHVFDGVEQLRIYAPRYEKDVKLQVKYVPIMLYSIFR